MVLAGVDLAAVAGSHPLSLLKLQLFQQLQLMVPVLQKVVFSVPSMPRATTTSFCYFSVLFSRSFHGLLP